MKTTDNKIISCRITEYPRPMPEGMFDPMPQVWVTMEDGSEQKLFEYYPDEIDFEEADFIGLSSDEAFALRRERDISFIRT
jgi:hypothetical protein